MGDQQTQESFGAWNLPAGPHGIEYSTQLIEDIAAAARVGFNKFPRGGVEVGGLLFGTRDRSGVSIVAARSIPCEYTFGPSFSLSGEEHDALSEVLRNYRSDPALKELVPVGWYHSHTRSELALSDADLHLHNRHFSEPWQIALLLKPAIASPTRLAIFIKSERGDLVPKPALVVEIEDGSIEEVPAHVLTEPNGSTAGTRDMNGEASLPAWLQEPNRAASPGANKKAAGFAAFAIGLAALLALVSAYAVGEMAPGDSPGVTYWQRVRSYWGSFLAPPLPHSAGLQVNGLGDELTIRWNPAVEPLQTAQSAALTIWDGDKKSEKSLERDDVLRGSTTYTRHSDNVTFRLAASTPNGTSLTETARFVGRPPSSHLLDSPHEALLGEVLRQEREQLEFEIRLQANENRALEQRLLSLEEMAKAEPAPAPFEPEESLPELEARQPVAAPAPSAPVLLEQRPDAVLSGSASNSGAALAQSASAYSGPASGVLIWTGVLGNGSVLAVHGNQASTGTVTGQLPGTPVRMTVYPAELSSNGLTVFTSDEKHSGAGISEPPKAQNGWTQTTYLYAPDRVQTVEVLQRPSQENNWAFVAVRARGQSISTVVFTWELLR
jgi:proteasome lid subunit RPN8/RPN11